MHSGRTGKRNASAVLLVALFIHGIALPVSGSDKKKPKPIDPGNHSGFQTLTSDGKLIRVMTPPPLTPREHNNRAVELGTKGYWLDAVSEHESAVLFAPANEDFRMNLSGACLRYGDALRRQNKLPEAIDQYRRALAVDARNAPAREKLDQCVKQLGHMPKLESLRPPYTANTSSTEANASKNDGEK